MSRILTWFIPGGRDNGAAQGPAYFIEKDYEVQALQVDAERAPTRDFLMDILVDGVSIMAADVVPRREGVHTLGEVEYNTLDISTFAIGESISGGSSFNTARVVTDNGIGSLTTDTESGAFTVGEIITGATSLATAVVNAHVREVFFEKITSTTGESTAGLIAGETRSVAADNFSLEQASIREGSWVSLKVLDMGGAQGVSVHLELQAE